MEFFKSKWMDLNLPRFATRYFARCEWKAEYGAFYIGYVIHDEIEHGPNESPCRIPLSTCNFFVNVSLTHV